MRDPRQLELNFGDKELPLTQAESDAQVVLRLQRSSVANYCYDVLHGHKDFQDSMAPSREAAEDYLVCLQDSSGPTDQKYREILQAYTGQLSK